MSITTLSSANYVRVFDNATLARPVATGVNVISGWIKPAAAGAGTNRGYFALSDTTTGTPRVVDVSIGTNNQLHVRIRSGTGAYSVDADFGSMVAFWDTWVHIAVAIEGPHDGTAKAYRVLRNGVELNTGGATFTSAVDSTVWDTTFCGRSQVVSSANGADKIAYYNISNVADLATAMQLVADLQTTAPASLAECDFAWSLLSAATATKGGVNFVTAGSPTFDADMPSFGGGGGGGGGSARVIASFF